MRLFLAQGVHAAQVADDLVLLDIGADTYFCLGGASATIALRPGGHVEIDHDETAAQLLEAGLLSREPTGTCAALPPRPTASARFADEAPAPLSFSVVLAAVSVTWTVGRTFFMSDFAQLLGGPAPAASVREPATAALIAAVAQFERLRPWLPLEGECLLRSYHLRAFLRARGLDALWVFGVRTWPFSAHCWLQVGETALDDDLERLAAYQPILAA